MHVSSVHALPEKPGGALVSETDVFSPGAVVGLYAKTKAAATAYALAAARGGWTSASCIPRASAARMTTAMDT